jgi:tRNA pseudouridine38-40 synthase
MPRYRLLIEYDGTPFVGWQIQPEGETVQGVLEEALRKLTGTCSVVKGAGRTDAGVHARGQVAHVDLEKPWPPSKVRDGVNFHVKPHPIAVLEAAEVPDTFDARFSATRRHYLYRILARRAGPAIERDRVWWIPQRLDADAMRDAASILVGRHDFTTFRATQCQAKSPVRTLDRLDVETDGAEILVRSSARSFLHNQVRSMVGSLKLVGEGKWTAADLGRALAARDRAECGPVAPAAGLYLMAVDYGDTPSGDVDDDAE